MTCTNFLHLISAYWYSFSPRGILFSNLFGETILLVFIGDFCRLLGQCCIMQMGFQLKEMLQWNQMSYTCIKSVSTGKLTYPVYALFTMIDPGYVFGGIILKRILNLCWSRLFKYFLICINQPFCSLLVLLVFGWWVWC
jgi:hypothetical protein